MSAEEREKNLKASPGSAGGIMVQAPLATREPVEHVIHEDRRVDPYGWMREKSDPRVREYLLAENAYTDAMMRSTEGFQERLYQEMLGRIQQTDLSVPHLLRGYLYYTRTEEGKQYPVYCRKREERQAETGPKRPGKQLLSGDALRAALALGADLPLLGEAEDGAAVLPPSEEEVLLDLNEMAVGHSFMGLGIYEVSDDNRRLAYATDTTGYRQYVLQVKAVGEQGGSEERPASLPMSGQAEGGPHNSVQPFRAERVTSAAWAADNRTLFYVMEDEVTKRSNRLWRHEFGLLSNGNPGDELIFEEKDERFRIDVERSRSGAYLFLVVNSHTTSEVRYLRADSPRDAFQLMAPREDEHEYYVDHHPGSSSDWAGGIFFIRTNSNGRTYRLMTTPTADPRRERWHEVIPNRPGVMLAGLEAFRTHLVLAEREEGLPYLRVLDLAREAPTALAASRRIEFAEPTYSAAVGTNPEFATAHVRYTYESLVTPRSVYDYNVQTGERVLLKQQAVLGGFDATRYVSERLQVKAKDGTMIPVSVVRSRNTVRDGSAALLLYGYGSYGFSLAPAFSSNRLSLLDRGMVYAIAHIRGGGELGKPWHDAGRMHQKMNTFTDFIACAEYLIASRYTSEGRVAIEGGSAGGLLMGAVTNLRPNLFHVVISHVPFVDVLNTMLDPTLPLTVGEYEEWGNPQLADDYLYMKQYCPYSNLERKAYPRMLVKTGWHDSQVMYWEAAKYVAKLRALKSDGNLLLLKTNMGAGHGGASGRYDYLREVALDYAFLLQELGVGE
jgi:oligopeptidase B